MNSNGTITVAIESAIGGGSLSLLRGSSEIGKWIGSSGVSKAEDLLVNFDELLSANGVSRNRIDLIAVSAGPGSFTGIRIGIATALGLKTGLGIPMASESALKAIALTFPQATLTTVVALPMGRDAVCIQTFAHTNGVASEKNEPTTIALTELAEIAEREADTSFLFHETLFGGFEKFANIVNIGTNVARSIGLACLKNPEAFPAPLFISKSF